MTLLEFTPLEFETAHFQTEQPQQLGLEFTPLEFETQRVSGQTSAQLMIRIYSVGV